METMRIGQLARKLDVTPTQIIKYLEELGIDVDKGVNTKLVKSGIDKVMDEFGKIEMEDESDALPAPRTTAATPPEDEVPAQNDPTNEELDKPITEEVKKEVEKEINEEELVKEEVASKNSTNNEEDNSNVEVIRPEYVKLQGLKVVDKIDLPEPKPKKETETETKEDSAQNEEVIKEEALHEDSHIITEADIKADLKRHYNEQRKKERKPKPQPKPRKKRTPLTYEQKLEREKKQAEKKKIELEKKLKEEKRRKYEERMKTVQPPAPKKTKSKKKSTETFPIKEKYKKEPTSIWGKFMKWLNT